MLLEKIIENSRDFLIKSDILPAEFLITPMSVSKLRSGIFFQKLHFVRIIFSCEKIIW